MRPAPDQSRTPTHPRQSGAASASDAISTAWEGSEDNATAAAKLRAAMAKDPALYREIMEPWEERAALEAVRAKKLARRTYLWNRPAAPDGRVTALARTNAVSLLDMRLTTGKRLGDAMLAEVKAEAEFYAARARQHGAKAAFFERIAAKMKGRKTVAQIWDVADLEEIKNAA